MKLSVVRPFDEGVFPVLQQDGFARISSKLYGRVVDATFQFFALSVRSSIRREFMLEFGSMLLVVPNEVLTLTLGGRFPDGSLGTWYPAHDEEALRRSIDRVRDDYLTTCRSTIESTSRTEGVLASTLQRLSGDSPFRFGFPAHLKFTIANCFAIQGSLAEAQAYATDARTEYEADGRGWARVGAGRCDELLEALSGGTVGQLHDEWRQFTVRSLKIEELWRSSGDA